MSKFTIVLLFAVAVVCVRGQIRLENAAQAGKWDEFNKLQPGFGQPGFGHPGFGHPGFGSWPAIPQPQDIKSLKPAPGTQVYGQSLSAFKSTSTVNGHRTEYSAGRKVVNNNGKVEETDFKP